MEYEVLDRNAVNWRIFDNIVLFLAMVISYSNWKKFHKNKLAHRLVLMLQYVNVCPPQINLNLNSIFIVHCAHNEQLPF